MIIEHIEENIDVLAVFSKGTIKPIMFKRRNKRYENLKVESSKTIPFEEGKRIVFMLSDEANKYEVFYDTRVMKWSLNRVFLFG